MSLSAFNEMTQSEKMFYGGITVMVLAVLLFLFYLLFHLIQGKQLRRKLEKEYGSPEAYITGHTEKRQA